MSDKINLLDELSDISSVPTLPTVVSRITTLLQNPQTSADEIGHVITTDQSLASKVLKLVNSAFYGFPGRISTITHAVVILGFSTIKNVVLTASIFEAFKASKSDDTYFDMGKFWMHSIACGAAAQTIAQQKGVPNKEEFFIAGLLHDIGKIIMLQYLPDEFEKVLHSLKEENRLFYDAELSMFSTPHPSIGGYLTELWNLPQNLNYAVKFHHNPSMEREHFEITAIVHAADIIVRALNLGNGGDFKIPSANADVWKYLNINEKTLPKLLYQINEEVEKATIFLQI